MRMDSGLPSPFFDVISLAVSGDNIFAGVAASLYAGVYLSTNHGISWTAMNNGLGISADALAVSGNFIFAGGIGVDVSPNNGASWTGVNNGLQASGVVSSFAVSGDSIFAGTDYGVYLSTNTGTDWTAVNNGLTYDQGLTPLVNSLAIRGSDIVAGAQIINNNGGVFLSTNGSANWTGVNAGLADSSKVTSVAIKDSLIFVGTGSGGGVWQRPITQGVASGIKGTATIAQTDFTLYPNPANSSFVVETTGTGNQLLQVFDISGKLMVTQIIRKGQTTIDAGNLASGIYTVSLKNTEDITTNKKLVIAK
jgi:hypothetical protein